MISIHRTLTGYPRLIRGLHSQTCRRLSSETESKTTCLWPFHKARQAQMEPFAGFLMPILYKGQSIKQEHIQTREAASAFDVSHMMQVVVNGRDRIKFIESLTVADLENLANNKCTLSLFPNQNGGIIDDCVIGKKEDHLHIVSNAGNAEIIWSWLNANLNKNMDVKLTRQTDRGLIALQGPSASKVLQKLVTVDLEDLEFMNTVTTQVANFADCQVTRCGYTGEDGFEISINPSDANEVMEILCSNELVKPAGLGARDTLRLEAGLCLHGHDISTETTPVEANLNWVIQKRRRTSGGFPGYEIIIKQLCDGSEKKRIGLIATKGGPPAREGSEIFDADQKSKLGIVTSGTFSPSLTTNIAMGYLPTQLMKETGKIVSCLVRGKFYEYNIAKMPFVPSKYYTKKK